MKVPRLSPLPTALAAAGIAATAVALPAWGESSGNGSAEIEHADRPAHDSAAGFVLPAAGGPVSERERAEFDAQFERFATCVRDKAADVRGVELGPNRVGIRDVAGAEAFRRVDRVCGLPKPPAADHPVPLTGEKMEVARKRFDEFVDCMTAHDQDVGQPEIGPGRAAIPLGHGTLDAEFREAERECGGPPALPR